MKLREAVVQTRERLHDLNDYKSKLESKQFRGSLSLTEKSIEVNLALLARLFEIYKTSCRMKGKEIAQSFEVFSEQ